MWSEGASGTKLANTRTTKPPSWFRLSEAVPNTTLLAIAFWRYLETGLIPEGAVVK
jgi:hypothetical protein